MNQQEGYRSKEEKIHTELSTEVDHAQQEAREEMRCCFHLVEDIWRGKGYPSVPPCSPPCCLCSSAYYHTGDQ